MQINLNEQELKKCKELLTVKELNMTVAEMYIEYLNYHSFDIKATTIDTNNEEESFYNNFIDIMDIDENDDEFALLNENSNISSFYKLNAKDYENDVFYKSVPITNKKINNWKLMKIDYEAYQGFVFDELDINSSLFEEHTKIGFFNQKLPYLAVLEGNEIWMSVIPHEINTMKEPINNAFGNILVLGLGLGYFPFMVSLKSNVKSITIIEQDKNVIELFNNFIFPYFKNKEKITIIQSDGIAYLKSNSNKFDYVFSDIWHNAGDGLPLYLKIKKFETNNMKTKFDYWIETSLLALFRRMVLTVFEEQLIPLKEEEYKHAKNENDKIINKIYYALKDFKINSFDDLHSLLKEDSLKKLAQDLNY